MQCQVCQKEFIQDNVGLCPGCGTIIPMMKDDDEIFLFLNWAQLRLVSMLAADYAEKILKNDANQPDVLIALQRTFDRIRSFGGERPLTFADEIRIARTEAEKQGESRPLLILPNGRRFREPLL